MVGLPGFWAQLFSQQHVLGHRRSQLSTGKTAPGDGNKMFALRSSQHVRLDNVHLVRGGWFTVIVTDVDYFTMVDTEINAVRDGIDICQCRHVRVDRCLIHNGGDDAVVLKSDYSTGMPKPSFDHVYSNSVVGSAGASALRFGSETVGEMFNMLWENITITGAAKAAIGVVSMDGSHIHDITYRNVTAHSAGIPFWLYIGARNRRPAEPGDPQHVGRIQQITVEHFSGTHLRDADTKKHPFWQWPSALDGQDVNATWNVTAAVPVGPDVLFRNVSLAFPGGGTANLTHLDPPHWANQYEPWRYCAHDYCPDGLSLPSYAWFVRHTTGLTIDGLQVTYDAKEARPAFILEDARNVTILGAVAQRDSGQVAYDIGLRHTPLSEVRAPGLVIKTLN